MATIVVSLCLAVFALCMVWAAVNDLVTMKIPNRCTLLLLAAFVVAVPFSDLSWTALGDHAIFATGTLVFCFCLFMFNALGAGDGKLIAATALWLGPSAGFVFVVLLAAFGGLLALAVLVMRSAILPVRMATHPIVVRLQGESRAIPYALAISPAALLALSDSPFAAWVPFLPQAL